MSLFCGFNALCFHFQLHLQLHRHLHSAQRHLVDSGPVRRLHLALPSDLLSQHLLPKASPPLEPVPIPFLSLDSRPTPPLHLGRILIHHQVGSITVKYVFIWLIITGATQDKIFFFFLMSVFAFPRWRLPVYSQWIWSHQQHFRCFHFWSRSHSISCSPCQPSHPTPDWSNWSWIQLCTSARL